MDEPGAVISPNCELALEIISLNERWREEFHDPAQYTHRVVMPNRCGRLVMMGQDLFYTWARLPYLLDDLPDWDDWTSTEGPLWLMDTIWRPGISAHRAIRQVRNHALSTGIAREGEKVLFCRQDAARYGYAILRSGVPDGQQTADRHADQ